MGNHTDSELGAGSIVPQAPAALLVRQVNRLPTPARGGVGSRAAGVQGWATCAIFWNDSRSPFMPVGFAHHFAQESVVTLTFI